jgi:hypothetical protein
MYSDEVNEKMKASQEQCGVYDLNAIQGAGQQEKNARAYYGDECKPMSPEPPTLRREAEERVGLHRHEAEKADQAAAFFRENPAFDLFIRLVRTGVIQF